MGMLKIVRRSAAVIGIGLAGGAAIVTVRHLLDTPQPLSSGLPGDSRIDRRHGGDIYYNVAGPANAQPMVLLHDFYPGASNFEYRAVFSALADRYRVYAPDWLGFGMSEHPNIAYTGEFYAHLLTGFVRDIVSRPAIIMAHGLAANIAVRAASDTPSLFERLILVAPEDRAGLRAQPTIGQTLARVTQRTMMGIVPYALLSTKPALRLFSNGTARLDLEAEREELHHRYMSSHQFGGHYALLALLTGELDLPMRHVFPLMEQLSLIISGELDRRHPSISLEELAILNARADLDVLPGIGAAILEEEPNEFLHFVDRWLRLAALKPAPTEASLLTQVPSISEDEDEEFDEDAIATDVTDESAAWLPEDEEDEFIEANDVQGFEAAEAPIHEPMALDETDEITVPDVAGEQAITADDEVQTAAEVEDASDVSDETAADNQPELSDMPEMSGEQEVPEQSAAETPTLDAAGNRFISRAVPRADRATMSTRMAPTTRPRSSGKTLRKRPPTPKQKKQGE